MARFRVVSKAQVSGWKFHLHRIEHALVRRDASMVDDPGRGRSTALALGMALAIVAVAGAAVLAFLKPAKAVGQSPIVADKDTGALYVHLGNRLHPALNLTSARLITGQASNPVKVPSSEISKYPRGPWVGIPGAPGQMIGSSDRDSEWTVCDHARLGAAAPVNPNTGLPTTATPAVRTTAIGGPITVNGEAVRELGVTEARLMRDDNTVWLIYRDGEKGVVKAAISLQSAPVVLALGIDATAPVVVASKGLLNAIAEAPPLKVPDIPGAGSVVTLSSGLTTKVGAVLTVSTTNQQANYYVVTQQGVVRVNPVVAAIVRNADSQGTVGTMSVGPDVVAANLRAGTLAAAEAFPSRPVDLVDTTAYPETCYTWAKGGNEQNARIRALVGRQLPLKDDEARMVVDLVTAPASRGNTADAAYLPRTTGRFVQVTGGQANSPLRGPLWWISDSGVRYGIDAQVAMRQGTDPTLQALNLGNPIPAPWSLVSLFAPGPTLSQRDARIQHDGINTDANGVEPKGS